MTLEADYAVRIVDMLAASGEKQDAATIAQGTAVPQRFALKILRKLVSSKIIRSYKGAYGGYMLSRAPEEITLREVIEAIEGPYVLNRCQTDAYTCSHAPCRFHSLYMDITQSVREKLDAYTFAQAGEADLPAARPGAQKKQL